MPLSVPPYLSGQLQSVGIGFPDEFCAAAGKDNAATEMAEGVGTAAIPLEALDAVVEAFAGAVGPIVFPDVLDIGAMVPDGAYTALGSIMSDWK